MRGIYREAKECLAFRPLHHPLQALTAMQRWWQLHHRAAAAAGVRARC